MRNSKPILLVEDDPADAMIFKHALNELGITNPVVHLDNGHEALDYLKIEGNKKPRIVLIDSNTPEMSGTEEVCVC